MAPEPAPDEGEGLTRDELLRFVYTSPQAMLLTSADGRVRLMSAGAVSLLMPLSADGSVDDLFALLEPHEPRLRALVREALDGPGRRLEALRVAVPAAGRRAAAWIQLDAVPFEGECSFTCHDVTAAVEREARYREAVAAEAHQRGKTETATAILHDLGNALTGIGGRAVEARRQLTAVTVTQNLARTVSFLEPHEGRLDDALGAGRGKGLLTLLRSMRDAAEAARAGGLASLEKMTAHLAHAQELLSIQRAYAGSGSAASRGRVSVERVLADVQSMMDGALSNRGGALVVAAPAARLPPVRVDRSKLMSVLLNLVKNAAEACDELPSGSAPRVELAAAIEADGGLSITVRDTGPGFGADRAARLFEDGFSTKERGSGVGLGACRKIIESLDGRLTLTSEGPGTGALATLFLPREVVTHDPA